MTAGCARGLLFGYLSPILLLSGWDTPSLLPPTLCNTSFYLILPRYVDLQEGELFPGEEGGGDGGRLLYM